MSEDDVPGSSKVSENAVKVEAAHLFGIPVSPDSAHDEDSSSNDSQYATDWTHVLNSYVLPDSKDDEDSSSNDSLYANHGDSDDSKYADIIENAIQLHMEKKIFPALPSTVVPVKTNEPVNVVKIEATSFDKMHELKLPHTELVPVKTQEPVHDVKIEATSFDTMHGLKRLHPKCDNGTSFNKRPFRDIDYDNKNDTLTEKNRNFSLRHLLMQEHLRSCDENTNDSGRSSCGSSLSSGVINPLPCDSSTLPGFPRASSGASNLSRKYSSLYSGFNERRRPPDWFPDKARGYEDYDLPSFPSASSGASNLSRGYPILHSANERQRPPYWPDKALSFEAPGSYFTGATNNFQIGRNPFETLSYSPRRNMQSDSLMAPGAHIIELPMRLEYNQAPGSYFTGATNNFQIGRNPFETLSYSPRRNMQSDSLMAPGAHIIELPRRLEYNQEQQQRCSDRKRPNIIDLSRVFPVSNSDLDSTTDMSQLFEKPPASPARLTDEITSPITFTNLQREDRHDVKCIISTDKTETPKLGDSYRLISEVCHLLPHGRKFKRPLLMELKFNRLPAQSVDRVVLFYSATAQNETPHWEMIPWDKVSSMDKQILDITHDVCKFSMSSFCLVCAAEGRTVPVPEQPIPFDLYVGLFLEVENVSRRWLVKIRLILSLDGFQERNMTAHAKMEVVRNSHLGGVRVGIHNINEGWALCESNQVWHDITVWQLVNKKRPEITYNYFSDTATGMTIFNATIRMHQENARNDCETFLEGTSMLDSLMKRKHGHAVESLSGPSRMMDHNRIGVQRSGTQTQNGSVAFGSDGSLSQAAATPENSPMLFRGSPYVDRDNAVELDIPPLLNNNPFDNMSESRMMNDIALVVDKQSTEVLSSLCNHLGYSPNLEVLCRTAHNRGVSHTLKLLEECKQNTPRREYKQKLRLAFYKYVNLQPAIP